MKPRWGATAGRRAVLLLVLLAGLAGAVAVAAWAVYRARHSVTADAFIESDIVELAPRVSGQIVEMLVKDSEHVTQGQLLCRIDPVPYRDQIAVDLARQGVAEADLEVARSALERLERRVPEQIAMAERELAVAEDEFRKAGIALEQIRATTNHEIDKAEQTVRISEAELEFAKVTLDRWEALVKGEAVAREERDAKKTALDTAAARLAQAHVQLAQARSDVAKVRIAEATVSSARNRARQAETQVALAKLGQLDIVEAQRQLDSHAERVQATRVERAAHETQLRYTEVVAPFTAVVAKRFKFQGDYATPGAPIFSLYDPDNLYVTANLEETKLAGVGPGHAVRLSVDAFAEPFEGRVLWVGKATGAQFALIPRDLSSGEFTKVVQRLPVRILIGRDGRWSQLKPGLSVTVAISHAQPGAFPNAKPPEGGSRGAP